MNMHLDRSLFVVFRSRPLSSGLTLPHAQQIRVITTMPELADITKQIGKELVDVESLTRGVEYMHAVPVKPSFVPKLNRADILVAMGLDLEISWLPALLEVASNAKIFPVKPAISIVRRHQRGGSAAILDRSEGDVHPKGNPHYNLDPAKRQNHRAQYRRRFGAQFSAAKECLREELSRLPGRVGESDCAMAEHGRAAQGRQVRRLSSRLDAISPIGSACNRSAASN